MDEQNRKHRGPETVGRGGDLAGNEPDLPMAPENAVSLRNDDPAVEGDPAQPERQADDRKIPEDPPHRESGYPTVRGASRRERRLRSHPLLSLSAAPDPHYGAPEDPLKFARLWLCRGEAFEERILPNLGGYLSQE